MAPPKKYKTPQEISSLLADDDDSLSELSPDDEEEEEHNTTCKEYVEQGAYLRINIFSTIFALKS